MHDYYSTGRNDNDAHTEQLARKDYNIKYRTRRKTEMKKNPPRKSNGRQTQTQ